MKVVLEERSVMNLQFILNMFYMKRYTTRVKSQWLWVFLLYHFVMCTSCLDFFFFHLLISDLLLSLIFTAVWANTVSEVMTVLFETDCITNSITEHMSKIIACAILKYYSWIYNLTIILWWHGELDSLFWGDQAITINQWKQKSSQCLRISFWYCIIGHNILSAHYQRLRSILPNDWYELMVSHRQLKQQASLSTNSFTLLVTFGIYQSQSCSVTPTGKWYCGINILLCGIKMSGHKNPLVEATFMGAQCWEATKHKLNQCHTASIIQ